MISFFTPLLEKLTSKEIPYEALKKDATDSIAALNPGKRKVLNTNLHRAADALHHSLIDTPAIDNSQRLKDFYAMRIIEAIKQLKDKGKSKINNQIGKDHWNAVHIGYGNTSSQDLNNPGITISYENGKPHLVTFYGLLHHQITNNNLFFTGLRMNGFSSTLRVSDFDHSGLNEYLGELYTKAVETESSAKAA